MFSIVFSNRFEILLDTLLDRLADEQPGPFGQRTVVVPSSALRRRVELAVAEREGICANVGFDYLAQWLWTQIGRVVEVPPRSPLAPALLAWRVFGLLDADSAEGAWVRAHPRLARYVDAADAAMRFELAERIARVFDHYLTYRPHWLEHWATQQAAELRPQDASTAAEQADEAWQAELWRRIHASLALRQSHPAAQFLRRVARMDAAALAATGLPHTVHVFGLPALPPLYLEILRALAPVVEVRLYALNPCREFWFEIVDARRLSWLAARQDDLFHETGNRLLAAWGQQTQAHLGLLFEGEHAVVDEARFAPHPGRHLLARLHNAILDLAELEPGSIKLSATDRSIELHVCHSRTRELEVLHDRLLGLFKGANPPRPDEIVVLTPDLDATAPLIEAVFGTAPPGRHIPWRITGLGSTRENPAAQALDRLLTLAASRFPASRVFDLLQQPVVAARFGLGAAELDTVHDWMRSAGIRWGLDAAQAAAAAASPVHTLEEGLQRLFLAWAAGDAAAAAPFAGRIGAGAPEGSAGLALGRFWRYADTVRQLRDLLLRPHDAEGWRRTLIEAVDRMVGETEDSAEAVREVRAAINALADDMGAGLAQGRVGLDVIQPALAARLDDPARGGVPGGTVTFSALSSLRGLPYRVVCVIGLDQGSFPGNDRPAEFDLMAARPQRGDRQRRIDDRNLFLDVVLAAREVLHLSYVGRSVRDGATLPPSVLVDELFDTLALACADDPARADALAAARTRLTVHHPLQAFALEYFMPDAADAHPDARLSSFNEEYAAALGARLRRTRALTSTAPGAATADPAEDGDDDGDDDIAPAAALQPFFDHPLPAPEPAWRSVSLTQLTRFFRNPCRFLLRERLGLDLPEADAELDDVEPFVPDWAGRQALAARLLPVLLGGDGALLAPDADAELLALARAGAEYPDGALGDSALRAELVLLRKHARAVREAVGEPLPPHVPTLAFELDGESWTLSAAFGDLSAQGQVLHRYDDTRAGDYLAAWLAHLVRCAAPATGSLGMTLGLARDGHFCLHPLTPDAAHTRLAELLALYRAGLSAPLGLFPKSAWAYVSNNDNVAKARAKWSGGQRAEFGEAQDPAYRLALRGRGDALDEHFYTIAKQVFAPLLAQLEDERLK